MEETIDTLGGIILAVCLLIFAHLIVEERVEYWEWECAEELCGSREVGSIEFDWGNLDVYCKDGSQ